MKAVYFLIFLTVTILPAKAQRIKEYKVPSAELVKVSNQSVLPSVILSPNGEYLLQRYTELLPDKTENLKKIIPWPGMPTNIFNELNAFQIFDTGFVITHIEKRTDIVIKGLTDKLKIVHIKWSPDCRYLALTNFNGRELELWICDITKQKAMLVENLRISATLAQLPVIWLANSEGLLVSAKITDKIPFKETDGPVVYDNEPTWGDIPDMAFYNQFDENNQLFEQFTTSQICLVDTKGKVVKIGQPAMYRSFQPSPDGQFILVQMLQRPFGFSAPVESFPVKYEIWDHQGNLFRELFEVPSTASKQFVPGSVIKHARNINWMPFETATLYWLKASDGGEAGRKAAIRDKLYQYTMPFDGDPVAILDFNLRCTEIIWAQKNLVFAKEEWPLTGEANWYWFSADNTIATEHKVCGYNSYINDTNNINIICYSDNIGNKIAAFNTKSNTCYFNGKAVTTEGEFPFIYSYSTENNFLQKSWQSQKPYYELPVANINSEKQVFLTLRESKADSPDYFSRNIETGVVEQITTHQSGIDIKEMPYSRFITITRKDSVKVTGIYTVPPGFKVGEGRLPVLVWINPEMHSKGVNKITENTINQFQYFWPFQPASMALKGYAIINITHLPVLFRHSTDSVAFMEKQLELTADALLHFLDSLPSVDKSKVCIGGAGAGASMAAYLLYHNRGFNSGIGIGGVYAKNCTQWYYNPDFNLFPSLAINDIYFLKKAQKMPFLLIDGQYSPTYFENAQFYASLKQNGLTSRLVILPDEKEFPASYQSMLHLYWEIENWLSKTLKSKTEK